MTDLGPAQRFAVGAVGEPGDRAFFLEVDVATGSRWFLIEKLQVAAMAARSREMLEEIGYRAGSAGLDATLSAPGDVAFRVAEVHLVYTEGSSGIAVELVAGDEEADPVVHFSVTPAQLAAFADQAVHAVAAGRPACPRCGLAMDRDGHICPTTNGDLRHHRP